MKYVRKTVKDFYARQIVACTLVSCLVFNTSLVFANPNPAPGTLPGGHSTPYGGVGSFDYDAANPAGPRLDVRDVANGTVIRWDNFDIGAGATTQFHQLSESGFVLNRVYDDSATGINGQLLGNGGIFVVNPRGVVIGPEGYVNARNVVVSALKITEDDFRNFAFGTTDEMKFYKGSCGGGSVENSGTIEAGESVYLVGKNVLNSAGGTIICPGGLVVLAAGDKVDLARPGSSVIIRKLEAGSGSGRILQNDGGLSAADGKVVLAAGDIFSVAIEGMESLSAEARRDIHLNGVVTATGSGNVSVKADRDLNVNAAITAGGDIALFADDNGNTNGDMHSAVGAVITAEGNIEIRGNDVTLGDAVAAGKNLTITGRDCVAEEETEWGNVWAKSTLEAGGNIEISVTGHEQRWVGTWRGGSWKDFYYPGTITLDGDVTAGGNLVLYNNTKTAAGLTLKAGQDIVLENDGLLNSAKMNCRKLTGETALTLVAGNQIIGPATVISVTGSSLTMQQGQSIDTADYLFANQHKTHLTLISDNGSVTSIMSKPANAANKWKSIGATADEDIVLSGNGSIRLGDSGEDASKSLWARNGDIDVTAAYNVTATGDLTSGGDMTVHAKHGIVLENADAGGKMDLHADTDTRWGYDVVAKGSLNSGGDMELEGTNVRIHDATSGEDISIFAHGLYDATNPAGSESFIGSGDVDVAGDLTAGGAIDVTALDFGPGAADTGPGLWGSHIAYSADGSIEVSGDVDSGGDTTMNAGSNIRLKQAVSAGSNLWLNAGGDIELNADAQNTEAGGNITMAAGDDVLVYGDLEAGGYIEIDASDDTITLAGDTYADDYVHLKANTKLNGDEDQYIEAGNWIAADGYVRKCSVGDLWLVAWGTDEDGGSIDLAYEDDGPGTSTYQGNLWLIGPGDIQISDDVTTFGPGCSVAGGTECSDWQTGGVAILSDNGRIYTEGGDDDTLNVSVTGSSDHWAQLGVYNPMLTWDDGGNQIDTIDDDIYYLPRVAVAIVSDEDLKIGDQGELVAAGTYYDDVDDRSLINFLTNVTEIPADYPRNPGSAFDLAVYTASTDGSVEVGSPARIMSTEWIDDEYTECVAKGAMVIDAYDSVSFGSSFEDSLASGDVGDRLEVVSRRTEWLEDAVGRLPYPFGGGPFGAGYNYVLRGSGSDNTVIGDDAPAWVLAPRIEPAPLFTETGQTPEEQEFEEGGCPALMNWLAKELGVSEEEIQIYVSDAFAYSTDMQPCEMCARLKDAAGIMQDSQGVLTAALAQVVNEFVATDAPPSEEQMAMIAAALTNPAEGTHYAEAGQWLDALAEYVGILTTEMGYSAGDSVALAEKYVAPIAEGDNVSLAAYVQARLTALGG